ncbi:cytochrome P450/oxidoreductase [Umezawaea sp. Da 62-37]|uniref:cytochrome P450/oxidoreductase n=1 Tax=Umezawaea sp. Da 62-37 TaxID=3075927 RepID=UPI0028F6CF10|nr:cytochrome P450/oxidoreductase [Umezawaea sp. Da 62-37]WNV82940.1 cytochrome P450/oxidoreductase [Umezawaea sp. Da 62-37]
MGPSDCPVSPNAVAFDPFGPEYLSDPPGCLRWSRDDEPVFYSPALGYWVVTRYEDVKAVFRDNALFSPSIALEKITSVSAEATAVLEAHGYAMARTLVNEDEPAHMPRRRALMAPFSPAELVHHEPMVRRLTREHIDRFVDSGRADLVDEMLWEVPLTVALHFLGVPPEDMATMRRYSIAHTVNTWGRPTPQEQVGVAEAVGQFWQYAGTVLEKMRRDPSGHGWMLYGIRVQRELPDVVTDSYLHSMMMAGIVAAHETTANAAANAIKLLLEHPASWRDLCADPALIAGAVDECLRHSGSVAAWRRLVTADTTIGGVAIPRGAKLLVVNSSANHDERRFADPDGFDIRRPDAEDHLTFGYGSHRCLGRDLARMEVRIFLEELTTRLPHLELVPDQRFTYLPNTSFRGPDHLWVHWDPAANPERHDRSLLARRPPSPADWNAKARPRTLQVDSITPVADDVVAVVLSDPAGRALPAWSAGAHVDVDLGGMSRQYSLCGRPGDRERYVIAVREEAAGRGGSRYVHRELRPGHALGIRGPRNHFHLDPAARRYVFVAGGIGITPIIAMADQVRAAGQDYEVHHCGRTRSSMAFLGRLAADHGDRAHVHCTDEDTRLDVRALFATPTPDTLVYACGPDGLLAELAVATAHWPARALRVEHFTAAPAELDPDREHGFRIELRHSGLTIPVAADERVLDALRAAGVEVPSDCEEGLCGSCEVPVVAGEIDHRDRVLSTAEREANRSMMSCCSRAAGANLALGM